MTSQELIDKYVDKKAMWLAVEIWVPVNTLDVRQAFGRIDVRITPIGGKGEMWVASDALKYTV
jgi:hypothetical protein